MGEWVWLATAVLTGGLIFFYWRANRRYHQLLSLVDVVTLPDVYSVHLENTRPVWVYLPPGYGRSDVRYPVLYVNDGQDAAPLRLHETLARLYAARLLAPLIVVAVPTNEDRLHEYGTAVAPNAQGLGSRAEAYGRFLTEELMPLINGRFRTLNKPENTAILGASLGGLSAFDIAWNHPHLFGTVGVFSGSFWWRAAPDETRLTPNALIAHEMVRHGQYRPGFRAWFEAGTRDETADRDNNGVIDAIQDTLELIDELEKLGYERGKEIVYVEVPAGKHNYDTWAKVLPDFLLWAFPATANQTNGQQSSKASSLARPE